MPSRSELHLIAETRLVEAKALFAANLYDGAYYLIGYAVETALKACICKLLDEDFPPSNGEIAKAYRTHRFEDLVILAGLRKKLQAKVTADLDFAINWNLVKGWRETQRYDIIGSSDQSRTQEVIVALEDPAYGVLTWLKTQW